jgi:hypothetical protein
MECRHCKLNHKRAENALDKAHDRAMRNRDLAQVVSVLGQLYEAQRATGATARFRVRESTLHRAWQLCGGGTKAGFRPYVKLDDDR